MNVGIPVFKWPYWPGFQACPLFKFVSHSRKNSSAFNAIQIIVMAWNIAWLQIACTISGTKYPVFKTACNLNGRYSNGHCAFICLKGEHVFKLSLFVFLFIFASLFHTLFLFFLSPFLILLSHSLMTFSCALCFFFCLPSISLSLSYTHTHTHTHFPFFLLPSVFISFEN